MKKSLFAKYFTVCSVIILVSLVFLGGTFSVLIARYLKAERQELLSQNVSKASEFTVYNYEINNGMYIEKKALRQFYSSLADVANGVMFFTDAGGNAIICTDSEDYPQLNTVVSKNILQKMKNGDEYREYGRLGGIYHSMYYTVARAVYVGDGTQAIGYVFCSTSASAITSLLYDFVKMFVIAAVVALVLSSIIIYIITQFLARPLREMSAAAKSFGEGDFSARVSYKSDDEIGELAMSFNQMADSLSELESMRKNFIANVSHELKTPMTTIGGFIDGILDGTIPREREESYLTLVSNEVKRLSRLVVTMLNVAKIEAGETNITFGPVNISEIIFDSLFSFEKKIDEKKIEVRGLSDIGKCLVNSDKDLVHQVIYNLIDNAVKFCSNNGYIDISVESMGARALIHIKNSGIGLSKEEIGYVFERFYKADKSRGLNKNGVGLGLHIVKSILELIGGEVTVSSVPGEYTEFTVNVPLYVESADVKARERRFLKK